MTPGRVTCNCAPRRLPGRRREALRLVLESPVGSFQRCARLPHTVGRVERTILDPLSAGFRVAAVGRPVRSSPTPCGERREAHLGLHIFRRRVSSCPNFRVKFLGKRGFGGAGEGASLSPGPCQPRLLLGQRSRCCFLWVWWWVGASRLLGETVPPRCRLRGPIQAPRQLGARCQTLLVVLTEPPSSQSEKGRDTQERQGTTW